MPKRIILLVPAIVATIVAAIAGTTGSTFAEPAADECLSKPNGPSPEGSHWYYRVDRANDNRHCWYLGRVGAKTRQAAAAKQPASATPKDDAAPVKRAEAADRQNFIVTDASPSNSTFAKPTDSPERAPAATRDATTNEPVASESQNEMPTIWPVLTPADRAAAQESTRVVTPAPTPEPAMTDRVVEPAMRSTTAAPSAEPSVKPAHVLAIAAGALLLVAIFFRAIYKVVAVPRRRPRRNVRGQQRSAAKAIRPRKTVAPARVAMSDEPGFAREAGNAGLIDAVLQRVRSSEASLSPSGSDAQASRPVGSRRVAAFG
jgi:hypothetical protein